MQRQKSGKLISGAAWGRKQSYSSYLLHLHARWGWSWSSPGLVGRATLTCLAHSWLVDWTHPPSIWIVLSCKLHDKICRLEFQLANLLNLDFMLPLHPACTDMVVSPKVVCHVHRPVDDFSFFRLLDLTTKIII